MPNFDPQKLTEFLQKNPDIQSSLARAIPTPELISSPEETKQGIQEPHQETKENPLFVGGHMLTLLENGKETEWRVLKTENGLVTITTHGKSGHKKRELPEESLKALVVERKERERKTFPPISDYIAKFSEKTGYSVNALVAWKRRWIDNREIDVYRKAHGTIAISDEMIEKAKEIIELYIEALKLDVVSAQIASSNVRIAVGILTGVQDAEANDIEYQVAHDVISDESIVRLYEDIEKAKNGSTPSAASTPASVLPTAPAPEPVQEQPLPPNVRETWPRHITHKPKEGWTYTHNGKAERLSDTESWNAAEANIKPIFDEYFKFITEGNSSEQGKKVKFFTDVIKLKNEVVGFLNAKDPESARKYAEALKGAFEEQKRAWEVAKKKEQQAGSVESSDKKYNTEKELITERVEALKKVLSEDETKTLLARVDDLEDAYQELRKHVVRQGSEDSPYKKEAEASFTEELKKLTEALKEKEVEHAEKLRTLRKEARKKEGSNVLRNAFYQKQMAARRTAHTLVDNKDWEIVPEKKVEKVEITHELLDKWHELATEYKPGDIVEKQELEKDMIFISYNRMFKKNQDTFLGLYSTPEYDKEENRIKYVSNKRFHMGTEQEKKAIRKVFELHNLYFVDPTREERRKSERQEKERETSSKEIFRAVYRPVHDKQKSLAEKEKKLADLSAEINAHPENKGAVKTFDKTFTSYRKGYESANQPQQMAEQTLHADVARYESVKSKRVRSDLPDTLPLSERASVRFGEMEKNLDNLMNDMLATKTKESHQKFIRALESYERDVETRVHAKREEDASPKTKEEREKKAEALKKIDAIIEKRIEEAGKKADLKWGEGNGRIRKAAIILVALAGGAAGAIGTYQFLKDTKSVEEPPRVESPTEQKKSMDDYVASYAKDLLKDIGANMSIRDLAAKEASLLVNKDKPSSIDNVLTMDARKVLYTEGVYNMSEEQQKQLSDMLRKFQNLYEATKAAAQAKAIANGTPFTYSPPNDFEPGYQTTVKDYMEKIIAEVKKADQ